MAGGAVQEQRSSSQEVNFWELIVLAISPKEAELIYRLD
jgi:hypothetical protein